MDKITFEAFEGIGKITPRKFFKYKLIGKGKIENVYEVINKVKYALVSNNNFKAVFRKDEELLSLEKLENIPLRDDVDIIFNGEEELDVLENKKIYEDVIVYYINNSVRGLKIKSDRKYRAANNREILTNYILDRGLNERKIISKKGFELKRKFNINPVITDDLNVILYVNCTSEFAYDKNIYEMMKSGLEVRGLEVKNT